MIICNILFLKCKDIVLPKKKVESFDNPEVIRNFVPNLLIITKNKIIN
jgi:hypothetical protein